MDVAIIRHAHAEEGPVDDTRALTPKGVKRIQEVARALARANLRFERILHSPKLRAVQTAEHLAFLSNDKLEVAPLLASPPSSALFKALTGDSIALVGHNPYVVTLTALLVTGRSEMRGFEFGRASVALLRGEPVPGGMRLSFFAPSKLLAKLA